MTDEEDPMLDDEQQLHDQLLKQDIDAAYMFITGLETELAMVLGVALGAAMKAQDVTTLRMLADLGSTRRLAKGKPGGLAAAVIKKYGGASL